MFFNQGPSATNNINPTTPGSLLTESNSFKTEQQESLDIINSVFGLEKETLEEFKVALTDMTVSANQFNRAITGNRTRLEEFQKAASDAIPEVVRLGGSAESTSKTLNDIALGARRNVVAAKEDVSALYAASQVLSTTAEKLVDSFGNVGVQFTQIGPQLSKSIEYVRSMGQNATQVMGDVLTNIQKLNSYNFADGIVGLTKMAAQASLMKTNMETAFALAEKAMNPEGAIEMAAAFQRLGVASGDLVDPFALMNKSINDPGALQDSIIEATKQFSYFDEETQSFKINPQGIFTMKEMAKEMGTNVQELMKMSLSAAELDKKLSSISPNIEIPEDDKMYLANIAKMGEGGRYFVEIDDKQIDLEEATQEQLDDLIKQQKESPKTMEEIAKQQLSGIKSMAGDLDSINKGILQGIVSISPMRKVVTQGGEFARNTLGTASEGLASSTAVREGIERLIDKMVAASKGASKSGGGVSNDDFKNFILESIKEMKGLGTDVTDALTDTVSKMLEKNKDFGKLFDNPENFKTQLLQSLSSPQPVKQAKDVIISESGVIQTDESDIITAFKPGGIISKVLSGFSEGEKEQKEIPQLRESMFDSYLTNLISKLETNQNKAPIREQNIDNLPLIELISKIGIFLDNQAQNDRARNNIINQPKPQELVENQQAEKISVKLDMSSFDDFKQTISDFLKDLNTKGTTDIESFRNSLLEFDSSLKSSITLLGQKKEQKVDTVANPTERTVIEEKNIVQTPTNKEEMMRLIGVVEQAISQLQNNKPKEIVEIQENNVVETPTNNKEMMKLIDIVEQIVSEMENYKPKEPFVKEENNVVQSPLNNEGIQRLIDSVDLFTSEIRNNRLGNTQQQTAQLERTESAVVKLDLGKIQAEQKGNIPKEENITKIIEKQPQPVVEIPSMFENTEALKNFTSALIDANSIIPKKVDELNNFKPTIEEPQIKPTLEQTTLKPAIETITLPQRETLERKINENINTNTTNQNVNFGGTVTFKVEAPQGVSVQYLTEYLNSERFKEEVYATWKQKQIEKEITV